MNSLRSRLVAGLALGLSLIWLAGVALSSRSVAHELDEVFDEALREAARRLLSLAAGEALGTRSAREAYVPPSPGASAAPEAGYAEELLSYVVRDRDGEVVLLSNGATEGDFPEDPRDGFSSDATHRFYTESLPGDGLTIQASDPLWHRREAVEETMLALAVPLPLLVLLSVALGWLLARHALGGVQVVSERIESRGGRDIAPLDNDGVPRELRPVVASVNRMLERLSGTIEAERGVASSSAHELRTPIATALAQTQRLATTLPAGASRERADAIATTLVDLGRLAEKLVQLGRAESGCMDAGELGDTATVIPHVIDEFRTRGADGGRVRYACRGPRRFLCRLDPDGLAIVLRNLIENALKHGARDAPVRVVLDGDANRLSVANDGPAPSSDGLDALRKRFHRGATDAPGAGLGLAIVDTILEGSGLALELRSPPSDRERGFEAALVVATRAPTREAPTVGRRT